MIPKFTRREWEADHYFDLTEQWAIRATCPKANVGCLIVHPNGHILTGGYNGAPENMETCKEVGCLEEEGHCVRSVHAEIRAIAYAARRTISLDRGVAFVSLLPCIQCMQALLLSGVRTIHYDKSYDRDEAKHVHRLALAAGVKLVERTR